MENNERNFMPFGRAEKPESPRVISEDSEEYKQIVESRMKNEQHLLQHTVFGARSLNHLQSMNEQNDPDWEATRVYQFEGLREILKSYGEQEEYHGLLNYFVNEYADILPELEEKLDTIPHTDEQSIGKIFMNTEIIDNDLFQQILESHRDNFRNRSDRLEKILPTYREEYVRYLDEFVDRLGIDVEKERVADRVNTVQVHLIDAMGGVLEPRCLGVSKIVLPVVLISNRMREEDSKHTIFHELSHESSGKILMKGEQGNIEVNKRGLLRGEYDENGTLIPRYIWLNESLTEALVFEMLQQQDPSYVTEIELLGELMVKGSYKLDQKILYDAYFENEKNNDSEPSTKWNQLVSHIDSAYVPGFLDSLDHYVTKYGTKEALQAMQEDWQVIVQPELHRPLDETSNSL